uniref:Uncharacterized protein n=1 Tax=Fusarium begoniae TaxID=48487 RepID=A0A6M4B2L4_9HYPO|nr:hypothetical protein [Fusarium begoniae]
MLFKVQVLRILMKKNYTINQHATVLPCLTQGIKKGVFLCKLLRPYSQNHRPLNKRGIDYNRELSIIYVNFIKALLHNELNLNKDKFKTYREILKFLEGFSKEITFSKSYVSYLKVKGGKYERVSNSKLSLDFIRYVKKTYSEFNESEFLSIPGPSQVNITKSPILPSRKKIDFNEKRALRSWWKIWAGSLELTRSFYNRIIGISKLVVSKSTDFLKIALVYIFIFIPLILILSSVQANDFDILDPVDLEDMANLSYQEEILFVPAEEDSYLKELKGIRSYADNLDLRGERPNHLYAAGIESSIQELGSQPGVTRDGQAKALQGEILLTDAHSEVSKQFTTPSKEKPNTSFRCDRPKKNFHSFFRMLDFNNLNYSPSLFQSYTFPNVTTIKYKFVYNLDNFWYSKSINIGCGLDSLSTAANEFFNTYVWNNSSINSANIPSVGVQAESAHPGLNKDTFPNIAIIPSNSEVSPNSTPPLSAYFEYNPVNLTPLDTNPRTLDAIASGQAKATAEIRRLETPNLTPVDAIISSYLEPSNISPRSLNKESELIDLPSVVSKDKSTTELMHQPRRDLYNDLTNTNLPTKSFFKAYSESVAVFEEVKSRREELELIQHGVIHRKWQFESYLNKIERKCTWLDEEFKKIKDRDLPESTGLRVPEILDNEMNRIKKIKEKILLLEKTYEFYGDLIEAYRVHMTDLSGHLDRLRYISIKANV